MSVANILGLSKSVQRAPLARFLFTGSMIHARAFRASRVDLEAFMMASSGLSGCLIDATGTAYSNTALFMRMIVGNFLRPKFANGISQIAKGN